MKLIHYTFVKQKYYRENQELTEEQTKAELSKAQYNWLKKTGQVNVRNKNKTETEQKIEEIKEKKPKIEKVKKIKKSSNDKLLEKHRANYKAEASKYQSGIKFELWRKNLRYGYYNFATYLPSLDEDVINEAIINDIKNQAKLAKDKRAARKQENMDDDI